MSTRCQAKQTEQEELLTAGEGAVEVSKRAGGQRPAQQYALHLRTLRHAPDVGFLTHRAQCPMGPSGL